MQNPILVEDDAWLALDNQLCFVLHATARLFTRVYSDQLGKFELTYPQYLVLLVLWEWDRTRPARPTVKALGERLQLDSGTLTPLLRRLEEKGLVSRVRGREDARELIVQVTKAGKALKRHVAAVPRDILAKSPMPLAEVIELRERLKLFRSNLYGTTAGSNA